MSFDSPGLQRIRDHRDGLRNEGRTIADTARAAQRDLTASEQTRIEQIVAEMRRLDAQEEAVFEGEKRSQDIQSSFEELHSRPVAGPVGHGHDSAAYKEDQQLRAMLIDKDPRPIYLENQRKGIYQPGLEKRDLAKGASATGGYTVPTRLYQRVID